MSYYKITNITNKLGKRDVNKDAVLKIEYHVGFQKKFHDLTSNNVVVLSCRTLPMSVYGLRAKQLITVQEITENEFYRLQKPSAKKPKVVEPPKVEKPKAKEPVTKKKTTRKSTKVESTVTVKEEV